MLSLIRLVLILLLILSRPTQPPSFLKYPHTLYLCTSPVSYLSSQLFRFIHKANKNVSVSLSATGSIASPLFSVLPWKNIDEIFIFVVAGF